MNIIRLVYRRLTDLLQLFYPPLCLGCQTIGEHHNELHVLCDDCLRGLRLVPERYVRKEVLRRLNPCYLDDIFVVFEFNETVQILIHEIKYRKAERLAMRLAGYAGNQLNMQTPWQSGDLVIPVPLFPVREKERGFNQSKAIAQGFFSEFDFTHRTRVLSRIKSTLSQTELSREERLENIYEAFTIMHSEETKGRNVILVDDVVTTGATLNECARVLKEAGTKHVWAITLATPVETPAILS
jgi:ComF family protein